MRATSGATAFARAWTVAYTIWLPREVRGRRREEIAADLWEQEHETGRDVAGLTMALSIGARVVRGMPADVMWSTGECDVRGGLERMNLEVDGQWDGTMGQFGRAAIMGVVALALPILIGLPLLFAVTVPVAAIVATLDLRRRRRTSRDVGIVTRTEIGRKRLRRAVALGISVAAFSIGLLIDASPSQAVHDAYWPLFVAPSLIALPVGVIALLMLAWTFLPRRAEVQPGLSASV